MGFSLETFMRDLEYMVSHGVSHVEILDYIARMRLYAKECGKL